MQFRASVVLPLLLLAGAAAPAASQQTPKAPVAILRLAVPSVSAQGDLDHHFFERVENELYREFLHDPNVEVYRSRSGGRAAAESSALLPITAGLHVGGLGDVYQTKIIWAVSTKSNRRGGELSYSGGGAGDATLTAQKIASAVHAIVDSVVATRASNER
jgi:hypothetical protein